MKKIFRPSWKRVLPALGLLIPGLFYLSACKKNGGGSSSSAGYKITLVQGGGQSDTTGSVLPDQLVFKVTYNSDTISSGFIRLQTYSSDSVLQSADHSIGRNRNTPPYYYEFQYLVNYRWKLSSVTGSQTLKAILLDSLKVPRDSVTVTATGIKPTKGWNASGDLPVTTNCVTFCQLPSGRVLTGLRTTDYPYYSDDEGSSWHALKTFPGKFNITTLIATPQNEVFAGISGQGMYYSADGGQSWEARNTGLTASGSFGNIQYTRSGKLFSPTSGGIFVSDDKGLHWHTIPTGIANYPFGNASSFSDSTIIAIYDNSLEESADGGEDWVPFSFNGASSLYIDSSDNLYLGTGIYPNEGLYVSTDKGQHYTDVYQAPLVAGFDVGIYQITQRNGWIYFYAGSQNHLVKTNDRAHFTQMDPPAPNDNGRESYTYFVTRDDHLIVSTEFYGLFFYIP